MLDSCEARSTGLQAGEKSPPWIAWSMKAVLRALANVYTVRNRLSASRFASWKERLAALLPRDRTGNHVSATEHGELLAHYARRLLALSREAQDALTSDVALEPVRIGVP